MIDWQEHYVEFVGELPHNARLGSRPLAQRYGENRGKVVVEGFYPLPPNPEGYVRRKILRVAKPEALIERCTTVQGDGNCYKTEGVYHSLEWTQYWVESPNRSASFGPEWDDWSGWHQD